MTAVQQSRNTFIPDREDTNFLQFQATSIILGFGFVNKSMFKLEEVNSPVITNVSPLVKAPTYVSKYRSTINWEDKEKHTK